MNKLINRSIYTICFAAASMLAGCDKDLAPEITSVDVSRLFSPTGIDVRVVDKTSVRTTWKAVNKADTYELELFANGNLDFSGTPVKKVSGIKFDQLPYIIPGLDGETNYSVRVKAVGSEIGDSKWVTATFKTDAEQIFKALDPNDLQATSVILKWPPGEPATEIVINPGNVRRAVTAGEITAGAATITGLTGETTYTATLLRGTKTRGTITFTTLLDLGGATAVNPGDDLTTLFTNAAAGTVFALFPGTYNTQDITLTKSISIKGARPTNKPTLTGTIFRLANGAGLSLKDVVMDGTGSKDGNQAIIYETDQTPDYGALKVENSVLKNYIKGLVYVNKKAMIESFLFKGNIISNIDCNGGDFIDFRLGMARTFEFTNNTVYTSCLARDLFRMDAGGSTNFPGIKSIITIQNNTFNNICADASRRVLYIRLALHEITFSKNILANTLGYYTNQASTTIKEMNKNNYFNAPNFTASAVAGAKNDATGTSTSFDPGFKNAAAADFTVSKDELKVGVIGDPRWL